MFDLTDLKTDLNEFNDFYSNNEFNAIERPQNPFHKNFESYQKQDKKYVNRNSLDASSFFTYRKTSLCESDEIMLNHRSKPKTMLQLSTFDTIAKSPSQN